MGGGAQGERKVKCYICGEKIGWFDEAIKTKVNPLVAMHKCCVLFYVGERIVNGDFPDDDLAGRRAGR